MEENQNTNEHEQAGEVISLETQQISEPTTPEISLPSSIEVKEQTSIPSTQPQTSNIEPQTKSMEVHKHPHHVMHKKKWNEYLLEFFMLFLAVFLGFFAENLRDHIKDKNEITQDIKSVLSDLESDVWHFNIALDGNTYSYSLSDSLVNLLHKDISNTSQIYKYSRAVTGNINYFYTNSKTFDQMKAAGVLKLIRPRNFLDSLGLYYVTFQLLSSQDDYVRLKNDVVCQDNYLLFDTYVFSQMKVGYDRYNHSHTIVQPPSRPAALLSSDQKAINEVAQNYYYLALQKNSIALLLSSKSNWH